MKTLEDVINKGWSVAISNVVKRIDSDWTVRICWTVNLNDTYINSEWKGFKTAKEAIADLIEKVNQHQPS